MERVTAGQRWSSAAFLLVSIVPGWAIAASIATTTYLYERTEWASVPFAAGALVAVAGHQIGHVLIDKETWPAEPGSIPWVSGVAAQSYITRRYLDRRARTIGLPTWFVLLIVWPPWFGLIGFWLFLAGHAVLDFLPR